MRSRTNAPTHTPNGATLVERPATAAARARARALAGFGPRDLRTIQRLTVACPVCFAEPGSWCRGTGRRRLVATTGLLHGDRGTGTHPG